MEEEMREIVKDDGVFAIRFGVLRKMWVRVFGNRITLSESNGEGDLCVTELYEYRGKSYVFSTDMSYWVKSA